MNLVFVHGWGFHGGIWSGVADRLRRRLPQPVSMAFVDLGFLAGGPEAPAELARGAVWIGHSLGVLWALMRAPRPMRGLVSVNGFDCFQGHVRAETLAGMRAGLGRNPAAQLRAFWHLCASTEPFAPASALHAEALARGLDWLATWDGRCAHANLVASGCPLLALAARDDAVVPPTMSAAIWAAESLAWTQAGGHIVPATQPEWCADEIAGFLDQLARIRPVTDQAPDGASVRPPSDEL